MPFSSFHPFFNSSIQGIWRPFLGRLQLLLVAIPRFGLQPPNRMGFSSDPLMSFVGQAFNSPNGDVRNAAVKVTTEVYRLMGAPIEKYLKNVKPVVREVCLFVVLQPQNRFYSYY